MITQLEKLSEYRARLQNQVQEIEENELPRIQIRNSCGDFNSEGAVSQQELAGSENTPLSNEFPVNRGQVPQI